MKIAIVKDTVPIPLWSEVWKTLAEKNSIEYEEFDSLDSDFLDRILAYDPDRVLWRSGNSPLRKFKDETQRLFLDKTKLRIVSDWNTHWLYDHKIRQTCLFKLHNIPHPETHIYFTEKQAMDSLKAVKYPFIIKADAGAGSTSLRFVEDRETAINIIEGAFHRKGKWTGREYESCVIYAQEYLPIEFVWRVAIFKNKVAWGYKALFKPGTIKASGQGIHDFANVPAALLNLILKISKKLRWDWGMCDFVWNEGRKEWQILEVTDTCGQAHTNREYTYFRPGNTWTKRKDNTSVQEIVFNLFVLEER